METIFISLAAYRDPDLVKTVKSFYYNAKNNKRLFFSLVSHEDLSEPPLDFSFLPEHAISYQRIDSNLASGVCSGRHLANSLLNSSYDYFVQTDSHSRVIENWDEVAISQYKRCEARWGKEYLFTKYPLPFEFCWSGDTYTDDIDYDKAYLQKVVPEWNPKEQLWLLGHADIEDLTFGDLSYGFAANCVFGSAKAMLKLPYDPFLYFSGEEPTLGIRAYVNGINLVSPPFNFLWTNYNRENGKRGFHWNDDKKWKALDNYSRNRQALFYSGKNLGQYGILDAKKYKELQETSGFDFSNPEYINLMMRP